jgi:hypothetical protein
MLASKFGVQLKNPRLIDKACMLPQLKNLPIQLYNRTEHE